MPKPALGRKLDTLMKEAKASPPSAEAADASATLSSGMATLLRGGNGSTRHAPPLGQSDRTTSPTEHDAEANAAAASARRKRLLQVSLLLADVVLCVLAARVIRHGPVGFAAIALCALALALGAWLACLALWPNDENS